MKSFVKNKKIVSIILICFMLSFFVACIYPLKRDLFLGIQAMFFSETIISPREIISINYKRTQDDGSFFTVSKQYPHFIVVTNNKYVKFLTIKFKEPLQETLKFNIYIEKEHGQPLIKIQNLEKESNKIYNINIEEQIQNIIFVLGERIGDNFSLDTIIYFEDYKYYFNKIFHHNYFEQFKIKNYWLNVLKLFGLFMLLVVIFVVRKSIYKKNV